MPPLDFPSSNLTIGQLYAGPNNVQWQWDGSKWLGTPNTLGPIIVAASPPTFQSGQLWWDSTGGNLYLAYDDGNTQQWVPASNIAGLANAATKTDVGTALNNVGRNLIHNSAFTIAQRGAGPFTVQGYTFDRWKTVVVNDTLTVQQVQYTDAQRVIIGDEQANNAFFVNPVTGNAAAGSLSLLLQPIEGIRRLAGKTVIVSFWAHCGVTIMKLGVSFDQIFGTGGSPSAGIVLNGQSVTLTTNPVRYSLTFTLPSISGKTLGTNGDDCTYLDFWFSSGATNAARAGSIGVQTGQFVLWGVQLEIAQPGQTLPTPLEKRDPVLELQQCCRFYQTGYATFGANCTPGSNIVYGSTFAVPMRSTATMAISNPNYSNATGGAISYNDGKNYTAYASPVASGYTFFAFAWTASADL